LQQLEAGNAQHQMLVDHTTDTAQLGIHAPAMRLPALSQQDQHTTGESDSEEVVGALGVGQVDVVAKVPSTSRRPSFAHVLEEGAFVNSKKGSLGKPLQLPSVNSQQLAPNKLPCLQKQLARVPEQGHSSEFHHAHHRTYRHQSHHDALMEHHQMDGCSPSASCSRPWRTNYRAMVSNAAGQPPTLPACADVEEAVWQRASLTNFAKGKFGGPFLDQLPSLHGRGAKNDADSHARQSSLGFHAQPQTAKSAGARRQVRAAIRQVFQRCTSVRELDDAVDEIVLATSEGWSSASSVASCCLDSRLWHALRLSQPRGLGKQRNTWRQAFEGIVHQEAKRRRPMLGKQDRTGTPPPPRRPKGVQHRTNGLTSTHSSKLDRQATRQTSGGQPYENADPTAKEPSSWTAASLDPHFERQVRAVFCRLLEAGRVRRANLPRALELCGFRKPNGAIIDAEFQEITVLSSLGLDEFLRFVRGYALKQKDICRNAFMQYDEDKSGTIDTHELAQLLRDLQMEPMRHVLVDAIQEVDDDESGCLSYEEFEHLMELIRIREGFTRQEESDFRTLFNRFDRDAVGSIGTDIVGNILVYVGHLLTLEKIHEVVDSVDVDGSGSIDFNEFLAAMRRVRELEIEQLKTLSIELEGNGIKSIGSDELEMVLAMLGYFPNHDAVVEAIEDANTNESLELNSLWEVLAVYRSREGLTHRELFEVDSAFARYDLEKTGEISTLDTGKALRWFGYTIPFELQMHLSRAVDVDQSGKLCASELRKLIRMYWEGELKALEAAFKGRDKGSGHIALDEAAAAYKALGFVDKMGSTPKIEFSARDKFGVPRVRRGTSVWSVDLKTFIGTGIAHKKTMREQYRKNGGYSHQEIAKLQLMFRTYDTDNSGTISNNELGCLIKDIFPVMNQTIRPKLDELMKEITANGFGKLDFQDFIRIMREFDDIQAQEKNAKEDMAIESTCFSRDEVRDLRELFLATEGNDGVGLSFVGVKEMIDNVCQLGEGHLQELAQVFRHVAEPRSAGTEQLKLDFAEFLFLMRKLVDINFAHIRDRVGFGTAEVSKECNH